MTMSAGNYIKNSLFAGIVFLMTCCGMRGVPTGGPKDETSPQIVKSFPKNFSTNFKDKKITLKFDEFIQVKGFQNEFVISPAVRKLPKYSISGKKLILEFDTTLSDNTTYSMYFGKAVVDLNEGNVLDSNSFVFATGPVLDSLEITGKIIDANSGEPVNGVMVHLYKNLNDSSPIKDFPSYFTKSKNGSFKFSSLAAGKYKIFALEDANNNFLYDVSTEKIAFLKQVVSIPQDTIPLELKVFLPEKTKQKVYRATSPSSGKIIIPFNKGVEEFSIKFLSFTPNRDSLVQKWNTSLDSLSLWSPQFLNLDSISFRVQADEYVDDTLVVNFKKGKSIFSVKPSYSNDVANNYHEPLVFSFPEPLLSYKEKGIKIIDGKDTLSPEGFELDEFKMTLKVKFAFKPGSKYQIAILPKTFQNFFRSQNDTLRYMFLMEKSDGFGNLVVKYSVPNTSYMMQLITKNKVVAEYFPKSTTGELTYNDLLPGEYQFKFIIDENKDKKWTSGNYLSGRQPEKSILYDKPITVRANWDLEISVP